jgi:P4 family phage/plasmid primase-like protien
MSSLSEFLAKHSTSKKNENGDKGQGDKSPTHTRIADRMLNIYGGAYVIPSEELPAFYKLYYEEVFVKKKMEYLTEKQLSKGGAILVDLDFRYSHDVEIRQHTKSHIQDLINLIYLETLKEFFIFEVNKPFPIYVMEKPQVNRLEDGSLTKDGIHLIIGIQMDHNLQLILRDRILTKIADIWELPLINKWPSVLDEGISKGTTNWQMLGSRKPGNQAYEITQCYTITYDTTDGEFMMDEHDPTSLELSKNYHKISAQYADHPKFEINPKIKAVAEKSTFAKSKNTRIQSKSKPKLLILSGDGGNDEGDSDESEEICSIEDIKTKELLQLAVDNMLASLKSDEYDIKEIHDYTQILPEKYYAPGSHEKNRLVAFALKHTDDRLFLSWVMLRSKADDFDFDTIPDLLNKWRKYFKERPDGVTKRSILYWAKQDAFEDYMRVKMTTRDHFIEATITSPLEYDFAVALKYMFKDKYVCTSITADKWYMFKNHRWIEDKGATLRLAISKDMFVVYMDLQEKYLESIQKFMNEQGDEADLSTNQQYKSLLARGTIIASNMAKMKKSAEKDKIMREAAPLFYDGEFIKQMDANRYLMCFTNGVIDFKTRQFREGYPQDYITKCTNIAYHPCNDTETMNEITTFFKQLFPIEELNTYVWSHLASTLIGENVNQTFNIYRGNGSNGKSMLTDLMSHALGDYKGTVPITLVTDKRNGIGGTSSEVMQLKGVRYAVMQEPSKDAKINEGVMKELTGGDPIQARALYCESETFIPQFSLVVCTNTLFEINSNDDGTWRRICIVDFMSKFVDANNNNGGVITDDNPYQFPKDKNLKEKLPKWAPIFMSMLVNLAYESQGLVQSCDLVTASSNKYRQGQDHIAAFVNEMVAVKEGEKIRKQALCQQFKLWFLDSYGSRKAPKGIELCEYMDLKFGKCKKSEWKNVMILYPETEEVTKDDMEEC